MENISKADIIKTHLLYLEKLGDMLDRERTYYHDDYFPFLKSIYQSKEPVLCSSKSGVREEVAAAGWEPGTERRRNTTIDQFEYNRSISAIQVALSGRPKEIVVVAVVSGLEAFDNGKGIFWSLVPGRDYTVDYTVGVIALHTETNRGTVLTSISAGDKYSIVVKYIPLVRSPYDGGRDGEP